MCGIIGFNWEDASLLKKALKEIRHRGPDASGSFFDRGVSLGHNRLSIIDLSKAGRQPLSNEDGKIWITFNGEIYNYKEIKDALVGKHKFISETDTEVLVHLYEEKGVDMLRYLNGIFAFCIYDSRKKIFFIARDYAGIKPLYYYQDKKKFIFCSEIKGILKDDNIKREVNLEALPSYLMFRANTGEDTFFKRIKKLKPGHFMVYNLKSRELTMKKYWDIVFNPDKLGEKDFIEELKIALDKSVKSQLMSDVPYGAYLSGGVDSGTIVSLMSKYSPQKVKTFSVGFKEANDNETSVARELAEKLKTEHHELIIGKDSIKYLPEIIRHADEPMADPTSIPIYLLSEYAKKHCTVILTGEGADELFGGYPQYKFMKMHDKLVKAVPKMLRKPVSGAVSVAPGFVLDRAFRFSSALGKKGRERFAKFLLSNDYAEQYLSQVAIFDKDEQKELLGEQGDIYEKYGRDYFKDVNAKNLLSACRKLDFKGNMVDDLLMKLDKNTMAFAVEGRVPFLDRRVIEVCSRIPKNLILKGFSKDKYILRKAVGDLMPKETGKRKKKHFFVPIDNWLKNELKPLAEELLSESYIKKQRIFNYNYIRKMKREFEKSRLFYARQFWSLITFQIWYRIYIERKNVVIQDEK